jgi:trimeric autotransporter adhesin
MKIKNMTTLHLRKSIGRSLSGRYGFVLIPLALACFELVQNTQAVSPPPDGGYPGLNTAEGDNALLQLTSGINNTAVGGLALRDTTTGSYNVAVGSGALRSNTTGGYNMAIGAEALRANNANFNLAIGFRVGFMNTTGTHLTGIGANALFSNTTAGFNTAVGTGALRENTTTEFNVAVGDGALAAFNGTTFTDGANTALGSLALNALTSGQENVVVGRRALETITSGSNNVVMGWRSGDNLTTGNGNTFIGNQAGVNEGPNVDNVICLGTLGDTQAAGQVTPNRCFIGNIVNVTTGGPAPSVAVVIDQDGQLGTVASSRQFKKDIKPIDQASEAILKLKPVTFHYKDRDVKRDLTPQFGLIAEDVEQVNRDLVVYGKDGKLWTVRYDAVNVMLLNEFLKEHKKVEEQQASIADLKSTVALQQKEMQVLTAQLKEQAAQIQNVSAQLEASKPALKVVANR